MPNSYKVYILLAGLMLINQPPISAQQVYIDKGVYLEGLWCFPLHADSLSYVYMPTRGRLSIGEDKKPKFSYLRYIINKPSENNTNRSITEADGGGILHFLVLYDTPEETVTSAEEALQKKLANKNIKIKGPVIFEKGSYALISSILNPSNGSVEKKLITLGEAPVLENSSIALSFSLKPQESKLLLESFKMNTPDVSIIFDLTFGGLTDAYDAELDIDWSEVKHSDAFKAGGSVYFVGADIEVAFEKMRRQSAIKLRVNGSGGILEGLLNTVYDKLLNLMFVPAKPEKVEQAGGLGAALNALTDPNGPMGSRKTTGFGINVGYQMKDMQSSGVSHLYFKGRSQVTRHHYVTFNIGNLYKQYKDDPSLFIDINLWDPTFQQREIFVGVDGDLEKEFKDMLNSVTIILNKKHQNGQTTLENVLINKGTFKSLDKPLSMLYGYQSDTNRLAWLNYEYKEIWQFQGGVNYDTGLNKSDASMINLYVPFYRKTILLDGDLNQLKTTGIRAVSIKLLYDFFGQKKEHRITLRPGDDITEKFFQVTLPNAIEEITYELTWIKTDGTSVSKTGKDKFGLIFVDEMPK
ncbi:MAG: hypothetical protein SH818_19090 [Saprospiraceae bacterium]|nr:hypothetical protein [Saprospiraceae bacterium]